jgi:tartrate-resistant acid phosphatase type 5
MKTRSLALLGLLAAATSLHAQAPLPDGSLRFLVVGDWGRRGAFHQQETANQMGVTAADMHAQFIVATGDNIYDEGVRDVHDSLWEYSFEDIYTAPALQVPWYVALGNHDYRTNPQAEVEYTLFSPRWKMPARYYSVVWQLTPEVSAEFFVVDTSPFISGYYKDPTYVKSVTGQDTKAQLAWLDQKLTASTARWKFVVGHHTVYSSSAKHGDNDDMIRAFRPLLEKHGVQAFINGHDHDMEVIKEGPVYYITSGAGSSVRGEMHPGANSLFANGVESGFLAVKLTPDRFDYRFIDWQGKVLFESHIPATVGK